MEPQRTIFFLSVRKFSQGNAAAKQWKDAASAKKDMDEHHRILAEQTKWIEHFQKTLESLGAMKVNADTPRPSPSSGNRSQQRSRAVMNLDISHVIVHWLVTKIRK